MRPIFIKSLIIARGFFAIIECVRIVSELLAKIDPSIILQLRDLYENIHFLIKIITFQTNIKSLYENINFSQLKTAYNYLEMDE